MDTGDGDVDLSFESLTFEENSSTSGTHHRRDREEARTSPRGAADDSIPRSPPSHIHEARSPRRRDDSGTLGTANTGSNLSSTKHAGTDDHALSSPSPFLTQSLPSSMLGDGRVPDSTGAEDADGEDLSAPGTPTLMRFSTSAPGREKAFGRAGETAEKKKWKKKKREVAVLDHSDLHGLVVYSSRPNINVTVLLNDVEQHCGHVLNHHFKEKHNFGFLEMENEAAVAKAVERYCKREVDPGFKFIAERVDRITPGRDPRTVSDPIHHLSDKEKRERGLTLSSNGLSSDDIGILTNATSASKLTTSSSVPNGMLESSSSKAASAAMSVPIAAAAAAAAASVPSAASSVPDSSVPDRFLLGDSLVPEVKNPTLVLKNLPFNLKFDKLQELLYNYEVRPQSINYHYDSSGVFRGMAFVKYKTADDAATVYDALNALEIGGRKLRAEYKRNQPKEFDPSELSEDQKKIYDQLVHFKDSSTLPDLTFPSTLTNSQRKQIHYLCEKIGLVHYSLGEGDMRFLVVGKPKDEKRKRRATTALSNSVNQDERRDSRYSTSWGHPRSLSFSSPRSSPATSVLSSSPTSWSRELRPASTSVPSSPSVSVVQTTRQPRGPSEKGFSADYQNRRRKSIVETVSLSPNAKEYVPKGLELSA